MIQIPNHRNHRVLIDAGTESSCFTRVILLQMLAIAAALTNAALGAPATFTPLGLFGGVRSAAYDVSADGSVVVGIVYDAHGPSGLFRWTAAGTVIGPPPLDFPATPSISADGAVIVGQYNSPNGVEAFRWPFGGTYEGLGDFAGGPFNSRANDVSADGNVIVGYGSPSANREAIRWTQASGLVALGGFMTSTATGVSGDGALVVGVADPGFVFRWTEQSGLVELPVTSLSPAKVSSNGSVLVGTRSLPPPPMSSRPQKEAYRWTEAGGIMGLGSLQAARLGSESHDVSANGSVVVGADTLGGIGPNLAFYWHEDMGMVNLRHLLISHGATGLDNWQLIEAWAVSADGNTVVGFGNHDGVAEAWVATVPEPSSVVLAAFAFTGMIGFVRLRQSRNQRVR